MDGIHDLGGRQGFGPVRYTHDAGGLPRGMGKCAPMRFYALGGCGTAFFNMDEYRHAIERMEPRHYLTASYYERSLTSLATLCVEKGIVTHEELERRAQGLFPLAMPSAPGRANAADRERFQTRRSRSRALRLRTGAHPDAGLHPRQKSGVVVGESPAYPFPDAHAHGVASQDEPHLRRTLSQRGSLVACGRQRRSFTSAFSRAIWSGLRSSQVPERPYAGSSASLTHASKKPVRHRQHHRPPRRCPGRPNDTSPPITPAKIRSSGRSAPFLIRNGRRKLSSVPTNHRPYDQRHPPDVVADPETSRSPPAPAPPGDRSAPGKASASSRSATPANGTPATREPHAAEQRLHERRDDHAECYAAYRLTGKLDRLLAAARRQASVRIASPTAAAGSPLAYSTAQMTMVNSTCRNRHPHRARLPPPASAGSPQT